MPSAISSASAVALDPLIRSRREFLDRFGLRLLLLVSLHALTAKLFASAFTTIDHGMLRESAASTYLFTVLMAASMIAFLRKSGGPASCYNKPFRSLFLISALITAASLAVIAVNP